MKKTVLVALMMAILLPLAGCGGHDNPPPPPLQTTQILSDPVYDGDIYQDINGLIAQPTQGSLPFLKVGVDQVTGGEYRTFLDFYLGGTGGVPLNAIIDSATLDVLITNILPTSPAVSIPIRIDLVSLQSLILAPADFFQLAEASTTITPPISQSDFSQHVPVDVTQLMRKAQLLGLSDFVVRISLDVGGTPGYIEINDTLGDPAASAPLLEVNYF